MDLFEKLAIAQAIYKTVADEVSTKGTGLRFEADEYMRQRYEESGEKLTKLLTVNGVEVGMLSTKESRPVAQTEEAQFSVASSVEFGKWMRSHDSAFGKFINAQRKELEEQFAREWFEATGEVPDGCEVETIVKPGRGRAYAGTVLRVNERAVAHALQGELPAIVQGLLEGEVE